MPLLTVTPLTIFALRDDSALDEAC